MHLAPPPSTAHQGGVRLLSCRLQWGAAGSRHWQANAGARGGHGSRAPVCPACARPRCQQQDTPRPAQAQAQAQVQQGRRSLLLGLAVAPLLLAAAAPRAGAAEELEQYRDSSDAFSLGVPAGWLRGEGKAAGGSGFTGASGTRRVLGWFPEGGHDVNLSVVITNVSADYTALGSFGTPEGFGTNLVSSMDRSYLLRGSWGRPSSVQTARLLGTSGSGDKYLVEYLVQRPGESEPRHLMSAVALGNNGRYNRFYTVTAQCLDSEAGRYRDTFQRILQSFAPPARVL